MQFSGDSSRGKERAWNPLRERCQRFLQATDGASAVEFALVAPILVLALVAMVDVGLAVYQRMMLDHALRAGAQTAMADPGTAEVLKMMQVTAEKNFPSADGKPSAVSFDPPPVRYCACPEAADVSPTAAPACSTTCANANPTFMYYRINARTAYKGMLIPTIPLSSSMRVQIR